MLNFPSIDLSRKFFRLKHAKLTGPWLTNSQTDKTHRLLTDKLTDRQDSRGVVTDKLTDRQDSQGHD